MHTHKYTHCSISMTHIPAVFLSQRGSGNAHVALFCPPTPPIIPEWWESITSCGGGWNVHEDSEGRGGQGAMVATMPESPRFPCLLQLFP